ncbi:MAG: M1 family aminopeptidase [Bacteroidota bacterium]
MKVSHEWFGNNITTNDIADMWIHEGFTDYSEPIFVECQYGKKAADEYCQGLRRNIRNDKPVIGPYGVEPGRQR